MRNSKPVAFLGWMASRLWAMERRALWQLANQVASVTVLTDEQIAALRAERATVSQGTTALIPIIGPIVHRGGAFSEFFGLATVSGLRKQIREAAASDEISTVVFEVDSPGGEVDGIQELAAEILALREQKTVISVVNTLQSSAAHWLAVGADSIIVTPSGHVGSIGVWTMHVDQSKMLEEIGLDVSLIFSGDRKVDGNPLEPLSEEAREDIQARVTRVHAEFKAHVQKARGQTKAQVAKYADGRLFGAKEAIALGVADKVGTLADVVARLTKRTRGARRADEFLAEAFEDMPGLEEYAVRCEVCATPIAEAGCPNPDCEACPATLQAADKALAQAAAKTDRDWVHTRLGLGKASRRKTGL